METPAGVEEFQPTLWSVVLRARDRDDPHRRTALNRLCETYWKPAYAYIRRKGSSIEDAKDLTQGFFVHFLEKGLLDRVEHGRGRFKSYLLAVLENYLANEYRIARAQKRGGGKVPLSLDFERAESEIAFEPADTTTPEDAFNRSWGLTVLKNAFDTLRREIEERGLHGHFEALREHLSAASDRPSYEQLAVRLGCSISDVTNLLHRCRKRLREVIRSILRDTVESEENADGEIRELFRAV